MDREIQKRVLSLFSSSSDKHLTMATLSAFSTLSSMARANSNISSSSSSSITSNLPLQFVRLQSHVTISSSKISRVSVVNKFPRRLKTKIRSSVAEEQETLIPTEDGTEEAQTSSATEQPVSVPVSPSDVLTMFFQVLSFLSLSLSV